MARRPTSLLALGISLVLLAGAAVTATASSDPTGRAALTADLDRILDDPRLAGARTAVVVRSAETGETLYDRGGSDLLLPASNGKLLTAAAALSALGPDHRFTTSLHAASPPRGGALPGDLHLRGTGDPTMLAEDYAELAERLVEAGVRVVRGDLVADDTWFDEVPLGVGWSWDDEPYYYSAQISALTVAPDTDYDSGTVVVRVVPGDQPGDPTTVEVVPPTDHVRVVNQSTTAMAEDAAGFAVERRRGGNDIVVRGSLAAGSGPVERYSTVDDPTGYAADVLRSALDEAGIRVNGGIRRGATPEDAVQLAVRESMPLRELLVPFMKLSNNGHAEILVKTLGAELRGSGTWAAGTEVLSEELAELGLPAAGYRMVDGSGLSRMDMVTAGQLADLLVQAREEPWFEVFLASLPVAGDPDRLVGGTLRSRMAGTEAEGNVLAKTGSLTGVTGLSGYVTATDGQPLVFSILSNNYLSPSPRDVEDAVAVRLAEYRGAEDRPLPMSRATGAPVSPSDDPATGVDESVLECSWVPAGC
ncbi:D-alanyl-D-alanine carboxypeptidase/D-alanyl-D-alanine endopeptidase [Actinoalloteichus caeruleus]|uniref:D-alanyl-D-alanine carboxypeptidase/D-alanyl-D-alanine endopeptidase n=1 Tax=Actinoalloteichus cyanogriseus TaxID=2893586 RepID=UPI003BB85B0F